MTEAGCPLHRAANRAPSTQPGACQGCQPLQPPLQTFLAWLVRFHAEASLLFARRRLSRPVRPVCTSLVLRVSTLLYPVQPRCADLSFFHSSIVVDAPLTLPSNAFRSYSHRIHCSLCAAPVITCLP